MSDFFDNIEDISLKEKETTDIGYCEFTVRFDIEDRFSELAKVNWEKILRNNIETALYEEMEISYSLVDESEYKSEDEYRWYEHKILLYRIFVYSKFITVRDCCAFLRALNVLHGRWLNNITHVITFVGTDDCKLDNMQFSFDWRNAHYDLNSITSSTENHISDIVCSMLNNIAANPIKFIVHYFHFIDVNIIKHMCSMHDHNMYYRIQKGELNKDNNIIPYSTEANSDKCNSSLISRTIIERIPYGIIKSCPRKSFRRFFSKPHDDMVVTVSLAFYFTKKVPNTEMMKWKFGENVNDYEPEQRYFFKYISQLSGRLHEENYSFYYRYSTLSDGNVMITLYAGDMYIPEIDDLMLVTVSLYGHSQIVFDALKEIYNG